MRVRVDGKTYSLRDLGWRTLKRGSTAAANQQDSTGASIWEWSWRYQPQEGQFLGFSNRRKRVASMVFSIYKDTTSEIGDTARIRLVVYYADQETQKAIIMDESYGTLKNASRDDIQKLITPTIKKVLKPGEWIRLEVNSSDILDISQTEFELGYKMLTN